MQADDVRWLFAYDRWATRRVLNVLDGLNPVVWTRPHVVGDRGLGGILVHHLGASMRWRRRPTAAGTANSQRTSVSNSNVRCAA